MKFPRSEEKWIPFNEITRLRLSPFQARRKSTKSFIQFEQ